MKMNSKGYTLVELMVVLLIFMVVLGLVGRSFSSILAQSSRLYKSEESNIEGLVGLEMLRHDLNQVGFGLATEPSPIAYSVEAAAGISATLNDGTNGPPRPVVALERSGSGCMSMTSDHPDDNTNYTLVPCSDYLALKATNLGASQVSQKWTYLNGATPNTWGSSADNPASNDSVVVLNSSTTAGVTATTLVPTTGGAFYYGFGSTSFANLSSQSSNLTTIYDIGTGAPRMPYNRADYFVAKPPAAQMSGTCASGTGVFYKAVVNQSDGKLTYYPLLDCVASMQVVFGWSTDGSGLTSTWSNADGSIAVGPNNGLIAAALAAPANASSSLVPTNIRNGLRVIKIYLLAQNGKLDPNYTSPSPIQVGAKTGEDTAGETGLTNYSYDINAAGWQHYRWKVYRVIVIPKNLQVNQ